MNDIIDRRQHSRIEVRWPIKIDKSPKIIKGETRNVAVDGISICCDEPLMIDDIVNITIEPQDQKFIEVYGKVIWSDVYGLIDSEKAYGIGVCFVQIAKNDLRRYHELVSILFGQ